MAVSNHPVLAYATPIRAGNWTFAEFRYVCPPEQATNPSIRLQNVEQVHYQW